MVDADDGEETRHPTQIKISQMEKRKRIMKIKKRKRFVFQNLINQEEKENFFLKILKIKNRKRTALKISQIEKRNRIFF